MDIEQVVSKVIAILHKETDTHFEITPDSVLEYDLVLDSLDRLEVGMACEEEFNIEIEPLLSSDTVRDVARKIIAAGIA